MIIIGTWNGLVPSCIERKLNIGETESKTDPIRSYIFQNYGAKIWNIVPTSYKTDISLDGFKTLIKSRDGPKSKCSVCDLYTK